MRARPLPPTFDPLLGNVSGLDANPPTLIGVGKSGLAGLPSLRTVHAIFPHTALQLVVDGLIETKVGLSQTIKTSLRKVRIGPTLLAW